MKSIRIILQFLKKHLTLTLLAPLCVIIEVTAELVQPKIMSEIVNRGVIGGESDIITALGLKMLIITLVGVCAGVFSIYAAGQVSYAFGADMRTKMFSRIQKFSFSNIDRLQTGSLITRITSDVTQVQNVIQASMRLLFRAPFMFIGAIVMVFMLDLKMAYILIIILPILLFTIIYILKKTFPLFTIVQQKMDKFNTVVQELLSGIRVVKAYVREQGERERFEASNEDYIASSLKVSKLIIIMMPAMSFIMNLGVVGVLWFGEYEVADGRLNVGDIMACTNYMTQILMSLMMAQRVIMSITQAEASMVRINEVLETECELDLQATGINVPEEGDLEFNNVSFRYEGSNKDQLSNISFNIKKGETLAILGSTGSGKSTLVNLIPRFYDVTEGSIKIGGKDIREIDRKSLQDSVGIVMQNTVLFSGSIADNMRMGKEDATEEEMIDALKKADIADFVLSLPDGLNHKIEQDATNISGGQRQRISIARTLISEPDILILDDSLSAVDLITESKIRKALNKLKMTKIIIAQRISSIKDANKILMIEDGKMLCYGSHDELYKTSAEYKEVYDSQVQSAEEGKL
ncbi:MAG: ABC transporter ATP-binding protein/permease [Paludibacteraceae bacterium]|nr:ABC transporter ATP-binding protein/permease [Paludibacteraceae bacterium]